MKFEHIGYSLHIELLGLRPFFRDAGQQNQIHSNRATRGLITCISISQSVLTTPLTAAIEGIEQRSIQILEYLQLTKGSISDQKLELVRLSPVAGAFVHIAYLFLLKFIGIRFK